MPRLMSMRPDVLCISNFGRDQANAIKQAVDFGVKQQMKIVVPVILHNQRLAVGPDVFEGVVGGANYYWGLETQSKTAAAFNAAFKAANGGAIPTDYGAYGYSGVGSLLAAMMCRPFVAGAIAAANSFHVRWRIEKAQPTTCRQYGYSFH